MRKLDLKRTAVKYDFHINHTYISLPNHCPFTLLEVNSAIAAFLLSDMWEGIYYDTRIIT